MKTEIIIALITGTVTLVTSLSSSILVFIFNTKKLRADQEKLQADQLAKQNEKIESIQKEIQTTLEAHRKEYLEGIQDVHDGITEMKAEYNKSQSIIELKIENLSNRVEKHNNVIERTYALEKETEVLKEMVKVANHRINDLEDDNK